MKYYAVKHGLVPGVYESWEECKAQVTGFSNALYKSFNSKEDAERYLKGDRESRMCNGPIAIVDGSYDDQTKNYSYGAIIIDGDKEVWLSGVFEKDAFSSMNNVAGELTGAMCAMKYALENNFSSLAIIYDFAGIKNWCTGDWRCKNSCTVLYKQYFDSISSKLPIRFFKVKGHSGVYYNELADSIAKECIGLATDRNREILDSAMKQRVIERKEYGR